MDLEPSVPPSAPPTRTRSRLYVVIGAVAVVAVVGALVAGAVISGHPASKDASADGAASHSAVPSQTSSDDPLASATPKAGQVITTTVATTSIQSFLTAVTKIDSKTDDISHQLSSVAAGAIVEEIANEQQELTANGWKLKGSPTIGTVSVVSTNTTASPETAVVQACVDSSKVVTLDSDGTPLGTSTGAAARALNIYTLQHAASGWRVVSRTFPANPNC
jgi:hypothetical protein